MSALAIAQQVISTLATGGVCWPMPRLMVTISPKWTGSMPTALTSGMTTGTTRMIAAAECRNNPRIRNSTLRIASTAHLLDVNVQDALRELLRQVRLGEIHAQQRARRDQQHHHRGLDAAFDDCRVQHLERRARDRRRSR